MSKKKKKKTSIYFSVEKNKNQDSLETKIVFMQMPSSLTQDDFDNGTPTRVYIYRHILCMEKKWFGLLI